MSDLPTKHADTQSQEVSYDAFDPEPADEITEPKMSDSSQGNNMLSNMAARSALGAAQAQRRKEGKNIRLSE